MPAPSPDGKFRMPDRKKRDAGREKFLESIAKGYSIAQAVRDSGLSVSIRMFYKWRDSEKEFRARWEEAYEIGTAVYEDELRRRSVEGVDEPVFRGEGQVGTIRKYSDRLLEMALMARNPTMYNPRIRAAAEGASDVVVKVVNALPNLDPPPDPESGSDSNE